MRAWLVGGVISTIQKGLSNSFYGKETSCSATIAYLYTLLQLVPTYSFRQRVYDRANSAQLSLSIGLASLSASDEDNSSSVG